MRTSRKTGWREIGPATDHDERVSRYCEKLASLAGLDALRCKQIRMAARLHDVGKVTVPGDILAKTGPLDADERALVEQHSELGYRILFSPGNDYLMLAATIALTHHERYDGSGYPRGLAGTRIPLEGRIVAICDVFDALTSDRAYRSALPLRTVAAIMNDGRGTHFDPVLLDLFLEALPEFVRIGDEWRGHGATARTIA